MTHHAATVKGGAPAAGLTATSSGALHRPRLVPQPLPRIMTEDEYRARLSVLIHTDRCRPQQPWVGDGEARPELVWEPATEITAVTSAQPLAAAASAAPALVARIKTEDRSSLSRGEDSCGVLPAWRTPSPSQSRAAEAERPAPDFLGASPTPTPHVFTISDDEDEGEPVEVSQIRRSASRSASRVSPAPLRQLKLPFAVGVKNEANRSGGEAPDHDDATVAAGKATSDASQRSSRGQRGGRQPRASSSGSSVMVLSAMPPTKKARTAGTTGDDGATRLFPRTMEEFLQTDP